MNSFTMIIVDAMNMMLYSVMIPALVLSVAMVAFICLLALIVRIGNTDQNTDVGRVNHYESENSLTAQSPHPFYISHWEYPSLLL